MFRLCWQGLDKWTNDRKIAKFLSELPVSIVGIYKPPKKSFAFLTFSSQADHDKMIELASGDTKFKGKAIKLKSTTIADCSKNKTMEELLKPKERVIEELDENYKEVSIQERVMGLVNMPYPEQLTLKRMTVIRALRKFHKKYQKSVDGEKHPEIVIKETLPSPTLEYYRNKVEFTIGPDGDGNPNVGFVNGNFRNATARVEDVTTCTIVPRPALDIVDRMKNIIKTHNISVRDFINPTGCLTQLTYRYSERNSQAMIIVEAAEDHSEIRQLLKEEFTDVTGVCFYVKGGELEVLRGDDSIVETVLGKQFKISPKAFFQTNTSACEVLYGVVRDIVQDADILLDVCCGTGTIGIVCADKVKKVIGLEITPEAVENAKYNAELNGVQADYYVGRAENEIKGLNLEGRVVAVVDPPRSGLHPTVLKVLRTTRGLDDIVYVSCNPSSLANDLLLLCHPEGKKYRAPHFVPQYLQPIDLFPHTEHVESVVYLKRISKIHFEKETSE